jgi:hypothetical protein
VAGIVAACVCRNCRHVVSVCRFGAGGIPRGLEDLADRGGTGPVAGLEHLALDPLIPPAAVLGGEALDQRGDLGADRRSSGAVRVGPFLSDQAAVPPQDGARRDQPVRPQPSGQMPDQRGQHRSVGPVKARLGLGAAQYGDLVP